MNNKNNSGNNKNKNKPSNNFWLSGFLEEAKDSGQRLENKLVNFKREHINGVKRNQIPNEKNIKNNKINNASNRYNSLNKSNNNNKAMSNKNNINNSSNMNNRNNNNNLNRNNSNNRNNNNNRNRNNNNNNNNSKNRNNNENKEEMNANKELFNLYKNNEDNNEVKMLHDIEIMHKNFMNRHRKNVNNNKNKNLNNNKEPNNINNLNLIATETYDKLILKMLEDSEKELKEEINNYDKDNVRKLKALVKKLIKYIDTIYKLETLTANEKKIYIHNMKRNIRRNKLLNQELNNI